MRTRNDSENAGQPHFPRQRDDLHVEELDGEAVLYDPRNGSVHRFNATTFMIWNGCSGSQTPEDIAAGLVGPHSIPVDEALKVVDSVIAALGDRDLLQHRAVADQQLLSSVSAHAEPPRQRLSSISSACSVQQADATETAGRGISRRELLSSGVTKGVIAAPVISTFFAAGAYASGPSASAAFGDGCKNPGYSCAVQGDCCDVSPDDELCEASKCCIEEGGTGCVKDEDCCAAATQGCIAGQCRD